MIDAPDAEPHAALIIAMTLALSIARDVLELDVLRAATPERITEPLRPCLHRLAAGGGAPPPAEP